MSPTASTKAADSQPATADLSTAVAQAAADSRGTAHTFVAKRPHGRRFRGGSRNLNWSIPQHSDVTANWAKLVNGHRWHWSREYDDRDRLATKISPTATSTADTSTAAGDAGWSSSTTDAWAGKYFDPTDLHTADRELFST